MTAKTLTEEERLALSSSVKRVLRKASHTPAELRDLVRSAVLERLSLPLS